MTTAPTAKSERWAAFRDLVLERGYTRSEVPFTLSSGGQSRDYVDLRRAVAAGDDLRLAAEAVLEHLERRGVAFDAIGGMTMGADPVAHAVALVSGTAWFSVRGAEKSHGRRQRIEGADVAGRRVVVFEDTTSTGRSILEALDAVLEAGGSVACATTLLDRGDVAAGAFAARNVEFWPLLRYDDIGIEALPAPV